MKNRSLLLEHHARADSDHTGSYSSGAICAFFGVEGVDYDSNFIPQLRDCCTGRLLTTR